MSKVLYTDVSKVSRSQKKRKVGSQKTNEIHLADSLVLTITSYATNCSLLKCRLVNRQWKRCTNPELRRLWFTVSGATGAKARKVKLKPSVAIRSALFPQLAKVSFYNVNFGKCQDELEKLLPLLTGIRMERCSFKSSEIFQQIDLDKLTHLEIYGLGLRTKLKELGMRHTKLETLRLRNLEGQNYSWMFKVIEKSRLKRLSMSFHQHHYPLVSVLSALCMTRPLLTELVLRQVVFPEYMTLCSALTEISGTLRSLDLSHSVNHGELPTLPELCHFSFGNTKRVNAGTIHLPLCSTKLEYLDLSMYPVSDCPLTQLLLLGRLSSLKILVVSGSKWFSLESVKLLLKSERFEILVCDGCRSISPVNRRKLRNSRLYESLFAGREQMLPEVRKPSCTLDK